jgi:GT2 family glycosyltransferase
MCAQVAIIILNWNGWEDTIECLESLFKINYQNYCIILVDNDSKDNSIEKIKKYYNQSYSNFYDSKMLEYEEKELKFINPNLKDNNKVLVLLKNSKNYGYAKGNNIGIRFAFRVFNPDYVLLLNNDTVVDENFLKELMEEAKKHEKVGIYAPKILKADNHQIIDSTGHIISWGRIIDRGQGKIDKHQYDPKKRVTGAKGAACLYKREMLESIGLFKEDYITSYEDAELSWRANRNHWKAIYVPNSIVYHKGERSTKKDETKILYFQNQSLKNMTSTVKQYGYPYQKIQYTLIILSLMIANYIPLLKRDETSFGKLNYINAIKYLYE